MIAFAKHEARIERLESRISATEDERDALLKSVDLMTEITRESMGDSDAPQPIKRKETANGQANVASDAQQAARAS